MVWAILVFLGVPLWLCALGISVLVFRARGLKARPGNVSVRVRRPGSTRWTRANAMWVSDVFVWRASPAAWAEDVRLVNSVAVATATADDRRKLRRLGERVALVTLTCDGGTTFDVAAGAEEANTLAGPFAIVIPPPPRAERYRVRFALLSIGGDTWIEDEAAEKVFMVHGIAVPGHNSLVLLDATGRELFRIQDRPVAARETMQIQDAGAGTSATVTTSAGTVSDRLIVNLDDGGWFQVEGNVADHEYEIVQGGARVAGISKNWFQARDCYGVDVSPGQNAALILAIAVCLDHMTDNRNRGE